MFLVKKKKKEGIKDVLSHTMVYNCNRNVVFIDVRVVIQS